MDAGGLVPLFVGFGSLIYVGVSPPEQAINQRAQFSSGGKSRDIGSEALCSMAEVSPQGGPAMSQR